MRELLKRLIGPTCYHGQGLVVRATHKIWTVICITNISTREVTYLRQMPLYALTPLNIFLNTEQNRTFVWLIGHI